jgi:2-dehydro-3-deoxygluconokinase
MTTEKPILCFGELLLRLAPPRQELFLQSPEFRAAIVGAEANVAVALASFGHASRMLTALPQDFVGDACVSELRRHGVDTSGIVRTEGRLGILYLVPGAVRRATEVSYDRRGSSFALNPATFDFDRELSGASWFHVSGVTPALGRACADAAIAAMRNAAARGVRVSFDGNYRAKLWQGREADAPAILRAMLENTTVFMGNERDLSLILGQAFDNTERAVIEAFSRFPHLEAVACTSRALNAADDQSYGAHLYTRTATTHVPPIALRGIVDRIGTGDAFAAGIIHGLIRGLQPSETLRFAHAAAVMKHSIPGDFLTLGTSAIKASMGSGLDVRR